jgi:hypothetical protein
MQRNRSGQLLLEKEVALNIVVCTALVAARAWQCTTRGWRYHCPIFLEGGQNGIGHRAANKSNTFITKIYFITMVRIDFIIMFLLNQEGSL